RPPGLCLRNSNAAPLAEDLRDTTVPNPPETGICRAGGRPARAGSNTCGGEGNRTNFRIGWCAAEFDHDLASTASSRQVTDSISDHFTTACPALPTDAWPGTAGAGEEDDAGSARPGQYA